MQYPWLDAMVAIWARRLPRPIKHYHVIWRPLPEGKFALSAVQPR